MSLSVELCGVPRESPERQFLVTATLSGLSAGSGKLAGLLILLVGLGGGERKARFNHAGVLERQPLLDVGHQFFGGCKDYFYVFNHRGVEVLNVVYTRAAKRQAKPAQAAQLHAVTQLKLGGNVLAHQVEGQFKFRRSRSGVTGNGLAHGFRREPLGSGWSSIPLARLIFMNRILTVYKFEFCHSSKFFKFIYSPAGGTDFF